MTLPELARLLDRVQQRWASVRIDTGAADAWAEDLAGAPFEAALGQVVAYAREGHEFAPTSGEIRRRLVVLAQATPPGFDELQAFLSRHVRSLPYGQTNSPADTVEALERLAEAGAHEALLRFVAAHGVYAVRMMPDPSLEGLDMNQQADRRDKARDYQRRVLPEWQRDPRPGLALERARAAALGAPSRAGLRPIDGTVVVAALQAGGGEQ